MRPLPAHLVIEKYGMADMHVRCTVVDFVTTGAGRVVLAICIIQASYPGFKIGSIRAMPIDCVFIDEVL